MLQKESGALVPGRSRFVPLEASAGLNEEGEKGVTQKKKKMRCVDSQQGPKTPVGHPLCRAPLGCGCLGEEGGGAEGQEVAETERRVSRGPLRKM